MTRSVLWASFLIVAISGIGQRAEAQQFQYAAKFVIGKPTSDVAAKGQYFTAINVHNPGATTTKPAISKRFAIAMPKETPGQGFGPFTVTLGKGQAMEIDTGDIYAHTRTASGTFLKGFVIITSNVELDVVGVYTASGSTGQVETLYMERVPFRRLAGTVRAAPDAAPGTAPATPD